MHPNKDYLVLGSNCKVNKKRKLSFLGSTMEDIKLNDFTLHGLPVPIYIHSPDLIFLFKDRPDCRHYLRRLYTIKAALEIYDPTCKKPAIHNSINFIDRVIKILI